ncbi:MAG: protein-L-isoaspartate O-methyltransferase [Kangiellaceae bacterium]|nr:protein-L-isoaspartate O-methyltransferase [Kangiellaceae bacterium]
MNIEQARFNMIEQQVKPWKVLDKQLLGAMSVLPRELFVSDEQKGICYADVPLPLGHQQNMLTPRELARLIQALELTQQDKVLEIGTGSGYASALLSKLTRRVYSVEIIADFVKAAQKIKKQLALENLDIEEGDACDGWMAHAPYDAILITSALPNLSDNLKRNLSENGRVISVLEHNGGQMATLSLVDDDGHWQHEYLFPIETAKMINSETTNQFVF